MGDVQFWNNRVLFSPAGRVAMDQRCCCNNEPPWYPSYSFTWNDQPCASYATYNDAYSQIRKWDTATGSPTSLEGEIIVQPGSQLSTFPGFAGYPLGHTIVVRDTVEVYYRMHHSGGSQNTHQYKMMHNGGAIDTVIAGSYSTDYIEGHFSAQAGDSIRFFFDPMYNNYDNTNSEYVVHNDEYWVCDTGYWEYCDQQNPGPDCQYIEDPFMPPGSGIYVWMRWVEGEIYTMAPEIMGHG